MGDVEPTGMEDEPTSAAHCSVIEADPEAPDGYRVISEDLVSRMHLDSGRPGEVEGMGPNVMLQVFTHKEEFSFVLQLTDGAAEELAERLMHEVRNARGEYDPEA